MTKLFTPVHFGIAEKITSFALGRTKEHYLSSNKGCPQRVALQDILKDDALQVRTRVEPRVVRQYSDAMQAGAEFPAITLARINGSLYLVDGWHRVEAAIAISRSVIWANVSEMSFDEARWQAAKANTQHGLPLKTKEFREVFRAFIESEQYRQGRKLMPYREIAGHIGKPFSTIRNWMKADYPRLFKRYQQTANCPPDEGNFDREAKRMQKRLAEAEAAVRNARNVGRTLDPERLGVLIHALRETLTDLETKPYEPVVLTTDF